MNSATYRYDHRSAKQRRKRIIGVLAGLFLAIVLVIGLVVWDVIRNSHKSANGSTNTVAQLLNENVQHITIDEPFFSFELPGDWKEVARKNNKDENYISWQATKKNDDARFMTLYIDIIPTTKAINRLVPVMAQDNMLTVGDVSDDNCSTFTGGGTLNAQDAAKLKETPAKWRQVDFICDLPRVVDNEVGTGSQGSINSVTVGGPQKGPHKYFFLYTDHTVQPNYSILTDALRSFRAK